MGVWSLSQYAPSRLDVPEVVEPAACAARALSARIPSLIPRFNLIERVIQALDLNPACCSRHTAHVT